jgi:hypothetical protein
MKNRVYLAGPMSGYKNWNYPAFHAAAKELRRRGIAVFSPAEFNDDTTMSWEVYLRRELRALTRCKAVYVLPGWRNSRGARLEVRVAKALGMPVREYKP